MRYSGNITGGSLLIRESRIVASLLLDGSEESDARRAILSKNLFQNNSPATTEKYCRLIFSRLAHLSRPQLQLVAGDDETASALALLTANLKAYQIVADFMSEVVAAKAASSEPKLTAADWGHFLEQRGSLDPEVEKWTESTRRKVGQVIIRMLAEAGYLDSTRKRNIQFPRVPEKLKASLEDADRATLHCLLLARP